MAYIPDVVCFHSPCDDGWVSALVVASYYRKSLDNILFVEGNYANEDVDYWKDVCAGKKVLVVDFSFKGAVKNIVETVAENVVILDHHVTAKNNISPDVIVENMDITNVEQLLADQKIAATFDMKRCGSMLAWDFFYPDKDAPRVIRYIDDQDRGIRKLPNAQEFTYWLRSRKDYKDYRNTEFLTLLDVGTAFATAMKNGAAVKAYADIIVADTIKGMSRGLLSVDTADKDLKCGFTLAPYPIASTVASSALDQLNLDIAIVFYQVPEVNSKRYGLSIRSVEGSNYARLFAESIGGGGHDPAAGANLEDKEFVDLLSEMIGSSDSFTAAMGENE